MELKVQDQDGMRLITVGESRIDATVAIAFKDMMRELTDDGPARVVLDMSKVMFLDSSGLGAIVAAMKQVGASRKLELAGLTSTVDKVFRLTRMDSVFIIHESVEDARNHPAAKAS